MRKRTNRMRKPNELPILDQHEENFTFPDPKAVGIVPSDISVGEKASRDIQVQIESVEMNRKQAAAASVSIPVPDDSSNLEADAETLALRRSSLSRKPLDVRSTLDTTVSMVSMAQVISSRKKRRMEDLVEALSVPSPFGGAFGSVVSPSSLTDKPTLGTFFCCSASEPVITPNPVECQTGKGKEVPLVEATPLGPSSHSHEANLKPSGVSSLKPCVSNSPDDHSSFTVGHKSQRVAMVRETESDPHMVGFSDGSRYIPQWTLSPNSRLTNVKDCLEFLRFAAPDAERDYQEQRSHREKFDSITLALAQVFSSLPVIIQEWDLQHGQLETFERQEKEDKMEIGNLKKRVEELEYNVRRLDQELLREKSERSIIDKRYKQRYENYNQLLEARNRVIKQKISDIAKLKKCVDDKDVLLMVARKAQTKLQEDLRTLKATEGNLLAELEGMREKATQNESEHAWLMQTGMIRVAEAVRSCDVFQQSIAQMVAAARAFGRMEGLIVGSNLEGAEAVKDSVYNDPQALEKFRSASAAYDRLAIPFVSELARCTDLEAFKAILSAVENEFDGPVT